jgi:hypothetical protein
MVRNLFFLVSATIFALVSTLLAVYNYNPYIAERSVFINFYTSLTVGLGGLIAILIIAVKTRISKSQSNNIFFWPSVRQGLIFSTAISTLLLLRGMKILDYLVGGSVIIVVVLLELFFETKKRDS